MIDAIGVIGNGFVGGAIVQGFNTFKNVLVYDSNPMKSLHTLEEVWRMNKTVRENWDWADSPSAVSSMENN